MTLEVLRRDVESDIISVGVVDAWVFSVCSTVAAVLGGYPKIVSLDDAALSRLCGELLVYAQEHVLHLLDEHTQHRLVYTLEHSILTQRLSTIS